MAAGKHNLTVEQGATFERTLTYMDSDGDPVDLTGCRVRLQVRSSPDAATTLVDMDSDDLDAEMTMSDLDETGTISFSWSDEMTALLTFDAAVYDMTLETSNGSVIRLIQGRVYLVGGVTR